MKRLLYLLLIIISLHLVLPVAQAANEEQQIKNSQSTDSSWYGKIANAFAKAMEWWADNSLGNWVRRLVTKAALVIKNVFDDIVNKVFDMLCASLVKIWNFTEPAGPTGVGKPTADFVNKEVMPYLYALAGCLLYLFVVLKLFASLLANENPSKLIAYFIVLVFLIISYHLLYNVTITLFAHILSSMTVHTITVSPAELARDFTVSLTGDKEMVNLISKADIGFKETDQFYETWKTTLAFWVSVIVEILTAIMFVFFIIRILLLKGQQLIQLFLSYFLGILILPVTILSGAELFIRWIKSFIGTCLYSFSWGLLLLMLYAISKIELLGLASSDPVLSSLPSILKLMMYFGVFSLMTEVGRLSEFFTGGDTFGKIASASSREFGAMLRGAGGIVSGTGAGALGAGLFAAGAMRGFGSNSMSNATLGTEDSGSKSGQKTGGGKGGLSLPGSAGKALNWISERYNAGHAIGDAAHQSGGRFVHGAGNNIEKLLTKIARAPQNIPNDGKETNMPDKL